MAGVEYGYRRDDLPTQPTQPIEQDARAARSLVGKLVTFSEPEDRADGKLALRFEYSSDLKDYLKQLPAVYRQYSPEDRAWLSPPQYRREIQAHLRKAGVRVRMEVDTGLVKEKLDMVPNLCQADKEVKLRKIPVETWERLFHYQKDGVDFGVQRKGRLLIADEQGLGKTVQAIMLAAAFSDGWPLFIVCPSSLRKVWKDQLLEWLPEGILKPTKIHIVMSGKDADNLANSPLHPLQVTIVSYDLASRFSERFCAAHGFFICDEAHMLKSAATIRSQFLLPLVKNAKHAVLITGTPLQARPIEIYSLVEMLRPGLLGSRDEFGRRYCGGEKKQLRNGGSEYIGASKGKELHQILEATIMVRRLKKDVLTDLPDKMRNSIPIPVSSESEKELEDLRRQWEEVKADASLTDRERTSASDQLVGSLWRATGRAKLDGACQHVLDLLDGGETQHKVLAFAHHREILDGLENALKEGGKRRCGYIRIEGRTPAAKRPDLVANFQQDDKIRVALLSIEAAGVGITLTAATVVVFAELTWLPAHLLQAEDRAHRVGQTKALQIQYLVAMSQHSADQMMWPNLQSKLKIVGRVVDGHMQGTAAGLQMTNAGRISSPPASRSPQSLPSTPRSGQIQGGTQEMQPPGAPAGKLPRWLAAARGLIPDPYATGSQSGEEFAGTQNSLGLSLGGASAPAATGSQPIFGLASASPPSGTFNQDSQTGDGRSVRRRLDLDAAAGTQHQPASASESLRRGGFNRDSPGGDGRSVRRRLDLEAAAATQPQDSEIIDLTQDDEPLQPRKQLGAEHLGVFADKEDDDLAWL